MRWPVLPLAVLFLASACGGGAEDGEKKAAAGPSDRGMYARLPLENYEPSGGPTEIRIRGAQDRLTAECMRQRGVAWEPPPLSKEDEDPEFRRYGPFRESVAKKFGYHPEFDPVQERRNQFFLVDMPSQQKRAYHGSKGRRGCVDEMAARLGKGTGKADKTLVYQLGNRSYKLSRELPPVKAVNARWSACMKAEGHEYPDPIAASDDRRWDLDKPEPSGQEVAVAVADVKCKHQVRLAETWTGAEAGVQAKLIKENATELNRVRQENGVLAANVGQILGPP